MSFIANDRKSFGDKAEDPAKTQLARRVLQPHLIEDLEAIDFPIELLSWYATIDEYLADLDTRVDNPPSADVASTTTSDDQTGA